ncbi:hypothetical protein MTO96_044588 [Rhipicephalus appendiculatus]
MRTSHMRQRFKVVSFGLVASAAVSDAGEKVADRCAPCEYHVICARLQGSQSATSAFALVSFWKTEARRLTTPGGLNG